MADGNGQPSYRVILSGLIQESIKRLLAEAAQSGIEAKTRRALATIERRLRRDPLNFGELKERKANLNLIIHVAVVSPLVVHFGILPQLDIVFVQKIYRI